MLVIKKKFIIFFFCIISTQTLAEISQTKLNNLFKDLRKTYDVSQAQVIEKKIWSLWYMHPTNTDLTDKLELGIEIMNYGNYEYALKIFNNIIKTDPMWAEAWNKRATLLYITLNYERSLKDIDNVLKIEPRHFGALSGRIQIFFKQKKYSLAMDDLIRLKKINPTMINEDFFNQLDKIINGLKT